MDSAVGILGLDRSTPDNLVQDGACEMLDNLRADGTVWRDIKPLAIDAKLDVFATPGRIFRIIYNHPAAPDDRYIAVRITKSKGELLDIKLTENEDGKKDGYETISIIASEAWIRSDIKIYHFGNILIAYNPTHVSYYKYTERSGSYSEYNIRNTAGSTLLVTINKIDSDQQPAESWTYTYQELNELAEQGLSSPGVKICTTSGDPVLATGHGKHWHGELLYFVALRMKDGTIITTSLPNYISSGPLDNFKDPIGQLFILGQKDRANFFCEYDVSRSILPGTGIDPVGAWRGKFGGDFNKCCIAYWNGTYVERINAVAAFGTDPQYLRGTINLPMSRMICPTLHIEIPEIDKGSNDIVADVAVYATRVLPILDYKKITTEINGDQYNFITDYRTIFADNGYETQPFYLVKAIDINDFSPRKNDAGVELGGLFYDFELSWVDALENVEQNPRYEPNQSENTMLFDNIMEYNSRLHFSGITTRFSISSMGSSSKPDNRKLAINIDIGDQEIKVPYEVDLTSFREPFYPSPNNVDVENIYNGRIIAYPDYRAKSFRERHVDSNLIGGVNKMNASTANNFAYKLSDPADANRFEVYITHPYWTDHWSLVGTTRRTACYAKHALFINLQNGSMTEDSEDYTESYSHYEPNRIQVSGINNPFNLPFANSYRIGTDRNEIIGLNSGAIEMSDAKFGEFPLFAFTKEGIFALQTSSQVLYGSIIPINFDRATNSNTLAINGSIVYITVEGIKLLSENGTKLISGPLNNLNDKPDNELLDSVRMYHMRESNELLFFAPRQPDGPCRAIIFALNSGVWSERSLHHDPASDIILLNNDRIVFSHSNSISILSSQDEYPKRAGFDPVESAVPIRFVSRPIKLGSMEYKRIETLIARLVCDRELPIRILIEGSTDLKQWMVLRDTATTTDKDIRMIHFPFSCRYIRLSLSADIENDAHIAFSGFNLEWFMRFRRKLR